MNKGGFDMLQNVQNVTNQSYAGSTLAQAAQPRLTQINERLEKTLANAAELQARLSNLADRLIGSAPEAAESSKEPPPPTSTVSIIEKQIEWIGAVLSRINQTVARLEHL